MNAPSSASNSAASASAMARATISCATVTSSKASPQHANVFTATRASLEIARSTTRRTASRKESETMSATEESSERTVTSTTPLAFVVAAMAPEETKSATTNRAKSGSPPVCLYTAPWSAMGSPTKCERFNRWRFASRPERRWRTFLPSPDVDEWSDPEDAPSAPEETLPSFPRR